MTRILLAFLVCWLFVSWSASGFTTTARDVDDHAKAALTKGEYNWYDAPNDRVRPVDLAAERESSWLKSLGERIDRIFTAIGDFFARIARKLHLPTIGFFGNGLAIVITCVGIALLVIMIRILWASAGGEKREDAGSTRTVGRTSRILLLPGEMGSSPVADPWAKAVERYQSGDYSGAIVFLFAHQLLELDRLGLIRLTPGGTGRKYVRSVDDSRFRQPLSATLGLFEQAYYGHKQLSASSFEPVWADAQLFQSQLTSIGKQSP